MNRNQQRDRLPETAEPDLEKTEMLFTKEPSFNFSLLEDGIESTFRFEDVGNVPGILNEVGDTGSYDFAPYSPLGNFTNGLNWTTYLAGILRVEDYADQDSNFSYLDATARELVNPVDPFGEATELNTFAGQIDTFESTYGTFTEDDLAIVNFGSDARVINLCS